MKTSNRFPLLLPALVGLALLPPAEAAPSFEGIGDGLLTDGLDGLLEQLPDAVPPEPGAKPEPPAGEDLGSRSASPLGRVEQGMATAERLIARENAAAETRKVQNQVVADLDALIEQAQKQCSQCRQSPADQQNKQQSQRSQPKPGEKPGQQQAQAGAQQRSQQAGQKSTLRLDTAGGQAVQGKAPTELMKEVWGRLPERVREQMLESSSDEFLPQYRDEIRQYFQRLAEEPE